MTLVLLSFLLLQLFQCSLRFLRGLSLVANPERKVLQSYGEFSYRANFLRLFSLDPLFSDFLKIYSEERLPFPISAPAPFSELSRLAAVALRRPFLKSECKGRHSPHSLQIFQKLFCTKIALIFVREIFKPLLYIHLQVKRIFTLFPNFFPPEISKTQIPPGRRPPSSFFYKTRFNPEKSQKKSLKSHTSDLRYARRRRCWR